ncbi:MAG TPA: hypothetical protein VNE16_08125 [Vicinamibacterales bacterium]|nr:hypothetical protein [Vicinamibacterales bacterium]
MEVSEVRRRLLDTIDRARRAAAARRTGVADAEKAYERFLAQVAVPVFRQMASALKAEGYAFTVSTPAGSVRLASDRAAQDFVELTLDTESDPPAVVGRASRERGRRVLTQERPIRAGAAVDTLDEHDVLEFLLTSLVPFVER